MINPPNVYSGHFPPTLKCIHGASVSHLFVLNRNFLFWHINTSRSVPFLPSRTFSHYFQLRWSSPDSCHVCMDLQASVLFPPLGMPFPFLFIPVLNPAPPEEPQRELSNNNNNNNNNNAWESTKPH